MLPNTPREHSSLGTVHWCSFFILALFLFSGFLFWGKKEKPSEPPLKIAILPVEHGTGRPLTVPVGRRLGQDAVEDWLKGKVGSHFLYSVPAARDPQYVPKQVYIHIGKLLKKRKYEIANPVEVFSHFNILAYGKKEIDLKELARRIPADRYLFITITYWDPEEYDQTGMMHAGYHLQLLDGKAEKLVWERKQEKRLFRIRQNQNNISSFAHYYDELIESMALDMIKGFPKR